MVNFTKGKVFTGNRFLEEVSVVVENAKITDLATDVPGSLETVDLQGGFLVPAFADLQIYGGNGLLFAEHPSVEALTATYQYSLSGGASHIMPTIATHSYEKIYEAIDAVSDYCKLNLPGVLGLHVEGPYINPIKKGAHAEQYIRTPGMDEVKDLMKKGKGIIKMITLAPEICSSEVLSYLKDQDIVVSAGHSNATYAEASAAFSAGIPTATHLYNAMSPLQHRAPGLVGAIFDSADTMCSVVADGHHVDFAAIRLAKKLMQERLFYITDAVTENTTGIYRHHFVGDKYEIADGTLSGSALTMLKAVKNGVEQIGISLEESLRMASLYPWQLLGQAGERGKIEKGYQADLVWLDKNLQLKGIYTQSRLTLL